MFNPQDQGDKGNCENVATVFGDFERTDYVPNEWIK